MTTTLNAPPVLLLSGQKYLWEGYVRATHSQWEQYPELAVLSLALCRRAFLQVKGKQQGAAPAALPPLPLRRNPAQLLKTAVRWTLQVPAPLRLPGIDVFLGCHSLMPNAKGVVDALYRELAGSLRVATFSSAGLWTGESGQPEYLLEKEGWWPYRGAAATPTEALALFRRAGKLFGILQDLLARADETDLWCLLHNPEALWEQALQETFRTALILRVLRETRPALVLVTHEYWAPLANFLVVARYWLPDDARPALVVVQHGEARGIEVPVLSDEMWTWDEATSRLVADASAAWPVPRLRVVGCPEADLYGFTEESGVAARATVNQELGISPDQRLFLFLSTTRPACPVSMAWSEQAREWLLEFTRRRPDWTLIIKTHPLGPEEERRFWADMGQLANVRVSHDLNFETLLSASDLVGSVTSSGISVAAEAGKAAARLCVPAVGELNAEADAIAGVARVYSLEALEEHCLRTAAAGGPGRTGRRSSIEIMAGACLDLVRQRRPEAGARVSPR